MVDSQWSACREFEKRLAQLGESGMSLLLQMEPWLSNSLFVHLELAEM